MLAHIEDTLPPTLHLPVSSEDTFHFYRYLHTYVIISNKQFLLLIDVPIQDRLQQLSIYKVLPWTSHTETSQHDMTSTLNTLALFKMKQ